METRGPVWAHTTASDGQAPGLQANAAVVRCVAGSLACGLMGEPSVSLFLILVTQADGSARRFPFVTYALALVLFAAASQLQLGSEHADRARADAVEYLHENPFVEVPERYELVIPVAYAEALRREFYAEREAQGLAPLSGFLVERGQGEFVDLLAYALSKVKSLPMWRYGISNASADPIDWVAHVGIHQTSAALWLSIVFVLCLGVALEDAWGPLIFSGLALSGVVATAFASVALGYTDVMHEPWFGSSGLVATLVGAHFVRSLAGAPRLLGAVPLPGWLVLLAWLVGDAIWLRGTTFPVGVEPAAMLANTAGLSLGALAAAALAIARFETRSVEWAAESEELVSNPALERAMAAKAVGRLEQAYDILRSGYRRTPDNRDLALALWDAALSVGKAARAVEPMLSVVESDLQSGHGAQAIANWFALADEVDHVPAPAPMLVRLAEALVEEGHVEAAMAALHQALGREQAPPATLAPRIVRMAEGIDPELTQRAARLALSDPHLAPQVREELMRSLEAVESTPSPAPAAPAPRTSQAAPEIEAPAAPSPAAASNDDDEFADIDPQAILLEETAVLEPVQTTESRDPEAWNDPSRISELEAAALEADLDSDDGFDDLDDEALAQAVFDAGAIEAADLSLEPSGAMAPRVDTSSAPSRPDETVTEVELPRREDDETTTVLNAAPSLRESQVREVVPVELEPESIVIEIEGGKKTRLPVSRIEALAVAAVSGEGARPIVVIDLVLNWQAPSEPLKLIRIRSDRFDPAVLAPGMPDQLAALQQFLGNLIARSGASPLPDFNAATGKPFALFQGLEAYAREVLGAKHEA